MSKAQKHEEIQSVALMDLIRTDCDQMRRRLDMLENYLDLRSGNFDVHRAFLKEIDQQIGSLRERVYRDMQKPRRRVA